MKLIYTLVFVFLSGFIHAEENLRFASIFSDNMVLQQKTLVNLWGYASANEPLRVNCSWMTSDIKLTSDRDGRWFASVKTPKGNFLTHQVSVSDLKGKKICLSNVLIGEVWLCSGQSNMEMILMNRPEWNLTVEGSEEAIANATGSAIRFVNIQRKESFSPLQEVWSYGWKVCTPNDVKWLSAVAYFFGKKLSSDLNVPVGLIVSAYGGSPVQSWIPQEIINSESRYRKEKENRDAELKASEQTEEAYKKAMSDWISDSEAKGIQRENKLVQSITLPVNFEKSTLGNQMGEVLLSRELELDPTKINKELKVNLGTMDDLGRVYFNGELVWEEIRNSKSYQQIQFTVSPGKIKTGKNLIEVRLLNILWGGGLTGPADNMYFSWDDTGEKETLAGVWQFRKVFDLSYANPIPREGKPLFSTASSLYNGMIFPLANYTMKGCLWYQGESNVGDEDRYPDMFTDLITSWRKSFGRDLPFYYVQIAPYQYGGTQDSKAAELREAQAKVERVIPKTQMVVTMDLGNPTNIHPSKKREVGLRLAMQALSETYGRKMPHLFPQLASAKRIDCSLVLTFKNVYKGLVAQGGQHEFEVSPDGKTFYPADIKLKDNTIRVSCAKVQAPHFVRYCWRDASAGTIFNSEKLPLSSFRAEVSN